MNKTKKIPIEETEEYLKPRLKEIDRVGEWARAMGYKTGSISKYVVIYRYVSR